MSTAMAALIVMKKMDNIDEVEEPEKQLLVLITTAPTFLTRSTQVSSTPDMFQKKCCKLFEQPPMIVKNKIGQQQKKQEKFVVDLEMLLVLEVTRFASDANHRAQERRWQLLVQQ